MTDIAATRHTPKTLNVPRVIAYQLGLQRLDQFNVRRLERLAFLFEMAWDFYQLENSLTPTESEPEYHHQQEEMKGLFSAVKRFWNEIEAVYNPRLVAISVNGIIIDWVDERTGEKPWFS